MPGTGWSILRFLAAVIWIAMALFVLRVAAHWAFAKWPNSLTAAMYSILGPEAGTNAVSTGGATAA